MSGTLVYVTQSQYSPWGYLGTHHDDVKRALATDGPVMIDVHVIPDEVRAPRLQSYQKPDGSFVSKPLEDMFPFLSREEFLANMIVKPLPE